MADVEPATPSGGVVYAAAVDPRQVDQQQPARVPGDPYGGNLASLSRVAATLGHSWGPAKMLLGGSLIGELVDRPRPRPRYEKKHKNQTVQNFSLTTV